MSSVTRGLCKLRGKLATYEEVEYRYPTLDAAQYNSFVSAVPVSPKWDTRTRLPVGHEPASNWLEFDLFPAGLGLSDA
jgi:hypothetical protein